jgi:hypothetical protein
MVSGEQTFEMQINWGEILMSRESEFVYEERVPLDCCYYYYYCRYNLSALSIKLSFQV